MPILPYKGFTPVSLFDLNFENSRIVMRYKIRHVSMENIKKPITVKYPGYISSFTLYPTDICTKILNENIWKAKIHWINSETPGIVVNIFPTIGNRESSIMAIPKNSPVLKISHQLFDNIDRGVNPPIFVNTGIKPAIKKAIITAPKIIITNELAVNRNHPLSGL